MIEWYEAQGSLPSLLTELTNWSDYAKFIGFPFKVIGFAALLLLFLLAATSHDFWLSFLSPPVWKWLHMTLYVAYGLVVHARRARHHAVRPQSADPADAGGELCAGDGRCISSPAGASARAIAACRRVATAGSPPARRARSRTRAR